MENVRTVGRVVEDVFCLLLLFSCAAAEESSVAGWMLLLFSFGSLIFFVLPINFESRGNKFMFHVIFYDVMHAACK